MKKSPNKNKDPQEVADEVYNKIGEAVFKAVEKNKYLNTEDTVFATAYSLISLAADLIKGTTKMDESEIFSTLAEVLAESLDIEFKIEESEADSNSLLELPKDTKSKKMLN